MIYHGNIVKKAFIDSQLSFGYVAERMGMSKAELDSIFDQPRVDFEILVQLYRILRSDITKDFPQLRNWSEIEGDKQPKAKYQLSSASLPELYAMRSYITEQLTYWHDKTKGWEDEPAISDAEYHSEVMAGMLQDIEEAFNAKMVKYFSEGNKLDLQFWNDQVRDQ